MCSRDHSGNRSPENASNLSYADFLVEQWTTLCRVTRFAEAETESTRAELMNVLRPWGYQPIGLTCRYRSYVAADGFPAELSLSWRDNRPEVRILFESLGAEPTARAAQDAGRALTRRLAGLPGVDIGGYLAVEELFVTDMPVTGRPTVWHSLAHRIGEDSHYKVYLNPAAHGADHTWDVLDAAMARLGLADCWQPVSARRAELEAASHAIEFFALDLRNPASARVKVYFRHGPLAGVSELDAVAALARQHDSARARRAYLTCYDDRQPVHNEPMTCLAFRLGAPGPEEANVYLRLTNRPGRAEPAADPVPAVLRAEGIDPAGHPAHTVLRELRVPVVRELLSYRTVGADRAADIGLYLRFPQDWR